MASKDTIRSSTLSTPVPLDMIEAWLRGEYLISQNESSGYELLGYSLMLRGLYVYTVTIKNEEAGSHVGANEKFPKDFSKTIAAWGICKIDLRDGDILFHGIRLGLNTQRHNDLNKDQLDDIKHVAWYSIFSKLTRVPGSQDPDMYFGYVLVPLNKDSVTYDTFRWYSLMEYNRKTKGDTDEKSKHNDPWIGFELPITRDADLKLMFTQAYSKDFRVALCNYLMAIEEDLDRPKLKNKDEVKAIGHIKMEQWKGNMRSGELHPVNPATSALQRPGVLNLFPLLVDNLGFEAT